MSDIEDADLQHHIETWRGFTRLMAWSAGIVIVVLALLAFTFL